MNRRSFLEFSGLTVSAILAEKFGLTNLEADHNDSMKQVYLPLIINGFSNTLPKNLLTNPGTLYEDFETLSDWTTANGTVSPNTSEFKTGTQSIKLTTNAGTTATMTKELNWTLGEFGQMRLWMWLHNPVLTDYVSIELWLSNDAGFANTFRVWTGVNIEAPNNTIRAGEWISFNFPCSYFKVLSGVPSWDNPIVRVLLKVQAAATKVVEVSFDSLTFGIRGIPALMLSFDDGTSEQYNNCFLYMKPRGIRGTLWADTGTIDHTGGIIHQQLQEMDAAGWCIGNHANSSTDLSTLSEAQQETAILSCHDTLSGWGLHRGAHYLAFPSGGFNNDTYTAMTNLGMLIGRTTQVNDAITSTPFRVNLIPDTNLYRLRSSTVKTTYMSLAQAESVIDSAISSGSVLALHQNQVGSGVDSAWSTADFQTLIDYIAAKKQAGLLRDITIDDYYKLTLGPVSVQ
jgi:peptidoglycan/xylan/chitin deacetylase (PgdA/CDA1 family)